MSEAQFSQPSHAWQASKKSNTVLDTYGINASY